MATAKPKRMMFGGMAKGPRSNVQKAGPMQKQFMSNMARGAPMTQSNMQAAAKQTAAKQVPAYAKPYIAAQSKSLADTAKAFSQQKSGVMPTGSQRAMKKGGVVKKKATKK